MYTVYVLKSLSMRKSYVGKTSNMQRRLQEHNAGKSFYTKRYIPWKIVYTETFDIEKAACRREKYLKAKAGREWMKKHLSFE